MGRDWLDWHVQYEDPASSLARRLVVVRECLRRAVEIVSPALADPVRLIAMCAGDGRDVIPVLAERAPQAHAWLVELNPVLAGRARGTATVLGLSHVRVLGADAGDLATYAPLPRAHILMACGVFGNVSLTDAERTVAALPGLLEPAGIVIWTRGREDDGGEPVSAIRQTFAAVGFTELEFVAPDDAPYRVGVGQYARPTAARSPHVGRLFTFRWSARPSPVTNVPTEYG